MRRRRVIINIQQPEPEEIQEMKQEIEVVENKEEALTYQQGGFSSWIFLIVIFIFLFGAINF